MPGSLISHAIKDLSNDHDLDEITDRCKVQPDRDSGKPCELRTGLELAYVGLVADHVLKEIRARIRENQAYQDWFYVPSLRSERKTGYDLSIGRIGSENRVRSMHKVSKAWCDLNRKWSLPKDDGDRKHLKVLVQYRQSHDSLRPFLILHICWCLHDYRRMGIVYEDFTVPGPESLLRTIVIPLEPLLQLEGINDQIINALSVVYQRESNTRNENEPAQDFLMRIGNPENHRCAAILDDQEINLPVLSLEEFVQYSVNHLLN